MKFVCDGAALYKACLHVAGAISNKTTIPALEGVLLRATPEGELRLLGYDLEVGIETLVEATIAAEGSIVLQAKLLCEILKRLPDDDLHFESDARHLAELRCGDSHYKINGMSAEEYPELPSISGGVPLPIPAATLREMIVQTKFAASKNTENKPIHTGVRFEIASGELRLVAIDGFRLAIRKEPVSYTGDPLQFVVPPKALEELLKLGGDAEEVAVGVGRRHIVFDIGAYHMVSRLLDGDFMNYQSAIPTDSATEATAETRRLKEAILRITPMITEKVKSPIKCEVLTEEGRLGFSCATGQGTANDSVPADIVGERLEMGFNNRFLLDALEACDTDQVRVQMNGAVQPVVILPPEGDSFLFMVLPVRLKSEGTLP